MEIIQNFIRSFFRNNIKNCKNNEGISSNKLTGSSSSESANRALYRINKKIRRSKLKKAVELYSEILLMLLVTILLLLCMYFFFVFEPELLK